MITEILSVGTELLLGQITNTDTRFLSEQLAGLGIDVLHHVTVGDNPKRAQEALAQALSRSDLVITTGGLGPTQDDLTKETVAAHFGLALVRDEQSYHTLLSFFELNNRTMTPNNAKQADFPQGAIILPNRCGTAPGCIVEQGGKAVIVLPGPPNELEDMFLNAVVPYLQGKASHQLISRVLRIFGKGESEVEHLLRDLMAGINPTIAPYAKLGEVTLRLTVKLAKGQDAAPYLDPLEAEIRARLGDVIYAYGDGETLASAAVKAVLDKGLTLATVESCTGGRIADEIVSVAGASKVFIEGLVTYSNEAKMRRVGVKEATLASYGAVSAQVASEMAAGLLGSSGADIAISVTGVAGPDGGTHQKPIGLVYLGLATKDGVQTKELRLRGDRQRIRTLSCMHALDWVRRVVNA